MNTRIADRESELPTTSTQNNERTTERNLELGFSILLPLDARTGGSLSLSVVVILRRMGKRWSEKVE